MSDERVTRGRGVDPAAGEASEDAGSQLRAGQSLANGKYRIERLLGEGGMGAVYAAEQVNLGRPVAVKVLLERMASRPDARRRFEREARVASSLRHPNAVEIYDVGEHEGMVFIAMQMLRGRTLWDAVESDGATLPMASALGVAAQLADVLVAAHDIGLVHRDLKPENIFLEDADEGWRVVVVDFGLAFISGEGGELGRMTREGLVVGTPPYLSPEQAGGLTVGTPSDIYAFGCVLYELLTGYPPFQGSELHVLTQHLYVAPVAPSEAAGDRGIPRELDDLVLAMLRKRPEERPPAREIRRQIETVEGTLAGKRARGRDDSYLKSRHARMVSVPAEASKEVGASPRFAPDAPLRAAAFVVGVDGELDQAHWIALRTNAILPVQLPSGQEIDAKVVDDAAIEILFTRTKQSTRVRELVETGFPVVAVGDARDMSALADLMRAGAAEVVAEPLSIDNLVRKLRRAHARHQRKQRGRG